MRWSMISQNFRLESQSYFVLAVSSSIWDFCCKGDESPSFMNLFILENITEPQHDYLSDKGLVNAITIEFLCKSNSFFSFYKRKLKKRINFPVPVIHQFPRPRDTLFPYYPAIFPTGY